MTHGLVQPLRGVVATPATVCFNPASNSCWRNPATAVKHDQSRGTGRVFAESVLRGLGWCGCGLVLSLALNLVLGSHAHADEAPALADLSLEELAHIEITSVSRHAESLSTSPASVFVITREAIRRSGASTLPQALRLAPNLQVAQIDARQYAINARGFNDAIGNKLLVLVDGRTVYTPFFSGVFWDQQDVLLEDIERIEVISGPGATLWGANAVNGVINVITRSATDTKDGVALLQAGPQGSHAGLRMAGGLGEQGRMRGYALRTQFQNTHTASGQALTDGGSREQVGFRGDWAEDQTRFTLQGDAYQGHYEDRPAGARLLPAVSYSGANLLVRRTHRLADGGEYSMQAYFDRTRRDDMVLYRPSVDVTDLEFQHLLLLGEHHVLWGGDYRHARDDIQSGLIFGFRPQQQTLSWRSLFVQDEVPLGESVNLDVGLKVEHNDYTGTEYLPSLRLAWQAAANQLWWAALSRAVRAPARLDRDIVLPPQPPFIIAGGPDFTSEVAWVAELGYRGRPSSVLNLSMTAYAHSWDRLRSGQVPPNAMVQNRIEGVTYGLEGWATWQPASTWRLSVGFTQLHKALHVEPGSSDPEGPRALGNDPGHQVTAQLALDLSATQELDLLVRRIGALPDPALQAYTAVDLRWGWRAGPRLDVELIGQNLFDPAHPEFGRVAGRSELPRQLLLRLRVSW